MTPDPVNVAALAAEHRLCGRPYAGCYSHLPMPHCRACGMAAPCDVQRIAEAINLTAAIVRPNAAPDVERLARAMTGDLASLDAALGAIEGSGSRTVTVDASMMRRYRDMLDALSASGAPVAMCPVKTHRDRPAKAKWRIQSTRPDGPGFEACTMHARPYLPIHGKHPDWTVTPIFTKGTS